MDSNPTTIQSCTEKGCVIRLHLKDGTTQGKIEAKLGDWAGEILRCGRRDLPWLLKHERAQKSGVYLLQGRDPSPTDDDKKKVYIGLSNRNLQSRISTHDSNEDMDFWDTACLITASDEDIMNHSNCHYLEAMLIKQTIDANRANIFNKQKPSLNLSSMDRQTPDNFICNLKLVLPVINMHFLNPLRATDKSIKNFMFELSHESKETKVLIKAFANQIGEDFFVLKGSSASIERLRTNQTHKNESDREALLKDKTLEENKDKKSLIFTKNCKFSSASAAASVVLNGHAGVREWIIKGTNEDYSHWRDNPNKFSFS